MLQSCINILDPNITCLRRLQLCASSFNKSNYSHSDLMLIEDLCDIKSSWQAVTSIVSDHVSNSLLIETVA